MQQIDNLTGLRAFAALSVLLFHIRYGDLADMYGSFAFLFKNMSLGVDVFFVLSGFILAYVHHSDFVKQAAGLALQSFLWARLARIYPVHLLMLLVVAFVLPQFDLYRWGPSDTVPALYANVLLIHAWGLVAPLTFNQPSWTISAEWLAYVSFPAIAFSTRNWRAGAFILLAVVCICAAPLAVGVVKYGGFAVRCLLLFTVGFCAFRVGETIPAHRLWRVGGIAAGPLLVFLFWDQLPYLQYLFPITTAFLILCLFKAGPIFIYSNPVAVYLGKISYSLYMSHIFAFSVLRLLVGQMLPLRYEIPLVLVVAALMYHFVEQPTRRMMLKRGPAEQLPGSVTA